MKHPFDGLIDNSITRRSALGTMVAGTIAATEVLADPPVATTLAIGEEGGKKPVATTKRVGEEGGQPVNVVVTTEPFGEEAGRVMSRREPGIEDGRRPVLTKAKGEDGGLRPSTRALGEEGGRPPQFTTQALGEEGGPKVTTRAIGEEGAKKPPVATTQAIGEEGGKKPKVTKALNERGIKLTQALKEAGKLTRARNENGGVATTLALGEEGGKLTRARNETGRISTVPVYPNSIDLNNKQLKQIWAAMAQKDSSVGVQACAKLYGAKNAIAFLKSQLKAENFKEPKAADSDRIRELIDQLNSRTFSTRDKAQDQLIEMGAAVEQAVQEALKNRPSVEQRMRLTKILNRVKDQANLRQAKRGIEVLVALRTPEAKSLLEELSKGSEGKWLATTAQQALKRVPR